MTDTLPVDTFTIRHVQLNDLPALEWDGQYHHYRAVFQRAFDEAQAGQRVLLLAEAAEAVAGQVFVQLNSSEQQFADGAGRGYIYALRVRPEWRNHGLGTRLVQAAEDELRARSFQTAVIAAGKDNPGARRLYERLGYRVFTEDPGVWVFTDVNGIQQVLEEPCWVMEKSLA